MRFFCAVLAVTPGLAMAEFDSLTQSQCEAALQLPQAATSAPFSGRVTAEEGSCVVTDLYLEFPGVSRLAISVERIELAASGMEALLSGEAPLQAVSLDLDRLRIRTLTDMPDFDYMLSIQQARNVIDADVSVAWNPETGRLEMDHFEVRFPYDQRLFASFTAENADLSSFMEMEAALTQLEVTDLRLEATTYGLFEAYFAPVLIQGLIGYSDDPEATVRQLQAQGVDALRALPPNLWTVGSREALEALVQDLPMPNGTIEIGVTAEPGIGMARAAPFALMGEPESIADLWPALGGIVVDATYDRVPLE